MIHPIISAYFSGIGFKGGSSKSKRKSASSRKNIMKATIIREFMRQEKIKKNS